MSRFRNYRRNVGGGAGPPAALLSAELHYNMDDGKLRIGFGDDGAGSATSARVVARDDFLYNLPAGTNGFLLSFSAGVPVWIEPPEGGATYTAGNGLNLSGSEFSLDYTEAAAGLSLGNYAPKASPTFTGTVTIPTPAAGDDSTKAASTAFVQQALTNYAPLASPALTGNPTAPTQPAGNNTTRLATTGFVAAAVQAIVGLAPAELDTLLEIATRVQQGETDQDAIVASLAGKLTAANNLSDVPDDAAARGNLGLGSMATQNASAVAITGGTIEGVILDAGVA